MSDGLSTPAGGKMLLLLMLLLMLKHSWLYVPVFPTAGSSDGWFT